MSLLVLCHLSAVEDAYAAVRAASGEAPIDVLAYGRSSQALEAPAGARIVALPELTGSRAAQARSMIRFVTGLRGRCYAVAYVAQPNLRLSRARGLLLSFPIIAGARRLVVLDPATGVQEEVSVRRALSDLALWLALFALSFLVARLGHLILEQRLRRPAPAPRSLPASGRALYLRTDVDLALAPLQAGGSASHTEGVIRGLEHHRFVVDVRSPGAIAGLDGDLPLERLPVVLGGNLPTEIAELLSGLRQAARLLRERTRPDLVYQRYSLNSLAGVILARRRGVPFVLEANASEAQWREEWSSLTHPRLAHTCERYLLSRADRITTVSENAGRGLARAGATADRLRMIPNGVRVERFAGAAPAILPFPKDTVVFAFSGLFYPWHGVPAFAEAFTAVHAADPRARLLLVGDGEEMPRVRATLARAGALDAACVTGLVPRQAVPGYLAAADVLVSPHAPHGAFVGSPIKLFEYLAAGRAMICTRVGQMAEILEDGRNARLVEPGDPAALTAAMLELCGNAELRARLAAGAAEESSSHSWDARVADLLRS